MIFTATTPLSSSLALIAAISSVSASIPDTHARQAGYSYSYSYSSGGDLGAAPPECLSAIASLLPLYSELPPAPAGFADSNNNGCGATATATAAAGTGTGTGTPSSLAGSSELSQWSSYSSVVLSWYSVHSEVLDDALGSCSGFAGYASIPVCTTAAGGGGVLTTADGSPTPHTTTVAATATTATETETASSAAEGSSSSSGSSGSSEPSGSATAENSATDSAEPTSSPTPTAGAARETGMMIIARAIAVAGIFGFVL